MKKEESTTQLSDLAEVDPSTLIIDTIIPFDCFIHLKLNNRIIHWLKDGDLLTSERKVKLRRLIDSNIYILKTQEDNFKQYAERHNIILSGDRDGHFDFIPIFGKNHNPSKTIFVGLKKASEGQQIIEVFPKPRAKVDADFINSVMTSIIDVFSGEFSIPVTSKPPAKRKAGAKGPFDVDIASFVGLTSQAIRGTVGLCFPTATYLYFLREVTGVDYKEAMPEYCIGCAEFMSSIFEYARPKLVSLGYQIDQAVPILVVGKNLSIPMIIPDKGFSIIFESPGGPFQFEVGIKTGN